jgi:hypothetical protein
MWKYRYFTPYRRVAFPLPTLQLRMGPLAIPFQAMGDRFPEPGSRIRFRQEAAEMSRTVHPDHLPDLLLARGSMSGPHRRTRPMTVSRWVRFTRWVRKTFNTWR